MPGSNNFTVHNPTNANQQPDGTFAGDSLTTGGIGVDAIMPSAWMNARWYEDSVGFWALAQAMANKGYVINKDNPATLAAVMANIFTNNDVKPPLISVAYSPTPAFFANLANGFDIVLGGNVTGPTLTGQSIGQTITFIITQGATPFSFIPPSNVNGWQPISMVANSVTIEQFIVKEDGTIWPVDSNANQIIVTPSTPGNSLGPVYTSDGAKIVSITCTNTGGTATNARVGLLKGPTAGSMVEVAADAQNNSAGEMFASMVVPKGWSYQAIGSQSFGGNCVLTHWQEDYLTVNS